MDQYTEDSQYDDDLTIGAEDEYDESFETGDVDLFEFGGEEESPIDRLKTLVLSIDWEITDEVLSQFNDEILDLKDIWADDKVNMVYLQALEKIGKYISREKADSHPNAIKLLLSMYYNLERIVLSNELSKAEIKQILLDDVRRFEKLKKLIARGGRSSATVPVAPVAEIAEPVEEVILANKELIDLKAIVLGIDWEITEKDLLELREEVHRLEGEYAASRPRLVFLQGIGTLGAYIRKKQSNSHADAFKLLHSFYEGLEKLVLSPDLTLEQEKAILIPEVEKFNTFKSLISKTLPVQEGEEEAVSDDTGTAFAATVGGTIAPAFADMPVEATHGFQEEKEAAALGIESPVNVGDHINRFFGEDSGAPVAEEKIEEATDVDAEKEAEALSNAFFGADDAQAAPDLAAVDRDVALQGVEVETEADDDSEEEALPMLGEGEIAPALADNAHVASAFSEVALGEGPPDEQVPDEITGRLDDFFGQEDAPAEIKKERTFAVSPEVALQGVDVEGEGDEDEVEPGAELQEVEETLDFEELAPAFADLDDDLAVPDDVLSDTELPMEPAEMSEPDEEEFLEIPVEADLDSDLTDLETVEEIEEGEVGELALELDQDVIEELEAAQLEEDLSELETTVDDSVIEQELTEIEQEIVATVVQDAEEVELDQVEVEGQVDDFFALAEEELEEPDELVVEEPAEAAEELVIEGPAAEPESIELETEGGELEPDELAVKDVDLTSSLDGAGAEEREEVVFELAEEEPEVATAAAAVSSDEKEKQEKEVVLEDEREELVVDELAADTSIDAESIEEKDITAEADLEETAEFDDTIEVTDQIEVEAVEEAEGIADEVLVEEGVSEFADLKGAVQSLSLDLEDTIIQGLFAEVNTLRQKYVEQPTEKTYLQLLSTVAQHIDQYRFNADDQAIDLLVSIMDDLEMSPTQEDAKAREDLLSCTCKVLQWQQNMLNSMASRDKDGYLAFSESDTAFEDKAYENVPEAREEYSVEEAASDIVDAGEREFAHVIRSEINALRDTLKKEIEELRQAVKK